ncbi:MAG: hypothetical protein OXK77_17905 [Gemmatimonadota bacterium]|nr:hypothetical protein [Gemmatimonadota bacterium]MDE2866695.1 hypothetical protein [Gemmatimonadota bacterium]
MKPRRGGGRRSGLSPGRVLAASILIEVESGRRLDVAWEASGAAGSPERGWVRTLVYGTVRLRGRIDHILSRRAGTNPAEFDREVLVALRMGAYQVLEMGGVPAYAAVSESVEQVKRTRKRAAAGLVNAVLRKVASDPRPRSLFPDAERDLEGYLATWGSHPRWLVRRWIAAFGPVGARALVDANNREPAVYLRPVGQRPVVAASTLAEAGLCRSGSRDHPWIALGQGTDPAAALSLVPGVIQDPAASLVVDHVSPPTGALVADLCAAPGGKALALSEAAGSVVAADLSERRLRRVVQGVRRLGESAAVGLRGSSRRVWAVAADARHPPMRSADTVLVDVPCSGTGTFRRHPDGRWRVRPADIRKLAALQRSILDGAATVVPRGGLLVYATCALEHEENEGQVQDFLKRHPDFRIEAGPAPERFLDENGCLVVLPHESGFDGAFAARMRRARD